MVRLKNFAKNYITKTLRKEEGATMVEYGLMVALIAMACIVAITLLGTNLNTLFNNVANALPGGNPAGT